MYAIIRTGGKQAKVSEGDVIDVERLKQSDEVTFTPLLLVTDSGDVVSDRSKLEKIKVVAEVLGERRGEKIDIFKYKNKTGYRRHQGHRQTYTTIQVTKISGPGTGKKRAKKTEDKPVATDEVVETEATPEPDEEA